MGNVLKKGIWKIAMNSEVVFRLRGVATCVGIEVEDEQLEVIAPYVLTLLEQAADLGFPELGETEPAFSIHLSMD